MSHEALNGSAYEFKSQEALNSSGHESSFTDRDSGGK